MNHQDTPHAIVVILGLAVWGYALGITLVAGLFA